MIQNNSSKNVYLRWNEFMQTYMVDFDLTCGITNVGAITDGTQYFQGEIKTVTTLQNPCNRAPCDLKDADIVVTDAV